MRNKGITLIALVITIIVMLILVLVTINVATDGGLIKKAKSAADQTQRSADYEELEIAIAAATNYTTGELTKTALENELRDGWTVTSDENGFICTSPNGNIFTVSFNGNIEDSSEEESSEEVPDALKQYIFGEDLQGRDFDLDLCPHYVFADSTGMLEKGLKELPEYLISDYTFSDGDGYIHYFKYDGEYFKIETDYYHSITDPEYGIKKIKNIEMSTSTTTVGLGSKIHYDNQDWIVLYDDTNEIQMVSTNLNSYPDTINNYNGFCLGYSDSYLKNHEELNFETNLENATYSYNNAIDTLNKACKEIIDTAPAYIKDVRCIGSNKNNKNLENTQLYSADFLVNNPLYNKGLFNEKLKSADENYIGDFERLIQLNIVMVPFSQEVKGSSYWLASRLISCDLPDSDSITFMLRSVVAPSNDIYCGGSGYLISVSPDKALASYTGVPGLRPVVIIDKTKCNFTWNSGNGYFEISEK